MLDCLSVTSVKPRYSFCSLKRAVILKDSEWDAVSKGYCSNSLRYAAQAVAASLRRVGRTAVRSHR